MALRESGRYWYGESFDDLAEYIRLFDAAGERNGVEKVAESVCAICGGGRFRVFLDDDGACVQRVCTSCGKEAFIADSAEHLDEADLGECECPCGGDEFAAAVGFSLTEDGEVRWISVGLRCLADGLAGVYAEWSVDYEPSRHLLEQA